MTKAKRAQERKSLSEKIKHLNLDEKALLVDDKSEARGTLKPSVHPFIRDLLSSR